MDFFSLMFTPFAHWGILVGGTLLFFILGWLWYNPITPIGHIWIKYFPMPSKDKMPSSAQFAAMLVFQLFMGFIVTHTVMTLWLHMFQFLLDTDISTMKGEHFQEITLDAKLFATFFIIKMYMGFVFIKDLGHWYFEQRPFALVLIGVGYYLVGILGVCSLLSWFL